MVLDGLYSFLDFILGPVLILSPFWSLMIISVLITIFVLVVHKLVTDQALMREINERRKSLQKEMKGAKEDPEKIKKINQKLMQISIEHSKKSFKPLIYTMLPILLIFGWLGGIYSFDPLMTGEVFSVSVFPGKELENTIVSVELPEGISAISGTEQEIVNDRVIFSLKAEKEGELLITFKADGSKADFPVTISKDRIRWLREKKFDSAIGEVRVDSEKTIVLTLFGWKIGWVGSYILFSIFFSLVLRKLFKIY